MYERGGNEERAHRFPRLAAVANESMRHMPLTFLPARLIRTVPHSPAPLGAPPQNGGGELPDALFVAM